MANKQGTVKLKHDALGLVIDVVAEPNARQQLAYKSGLIGARMSERYERHWQAARAVIVEFKSPYIGLDDDLDEVTDPKATDTIMMTAELVAGHMNRLDRVDPN